MEKITIENNTRLAIDHKIDQIQTCVRSIHDHTAVELMTINCDDMGYKTPNFTTFGIFRLHGLVKLHDELQPWALILKIIQPDTGEKDNTGHHNYWRREALVLASGLLEDLPEPVGAPQTYLVEEHQEGTVWLWMEHVKGEYASTIEQFAYIARRLGRFNGTYLVGTKQVPDHEWICRSWLKSWTTASRRYAPDMEAYAGGLLSQHAQAIWAWYVKTLQNLEPVLASLQRLPRVLAHQDLSQMNMFLVNKEVSELQLVLIDWQFMSISGVGEDLGKLFGVNLSLGVIPMGDWDSFQSAVYDAYLEGLREMGWQGDARLVRYGFCVSAALRCVWEVPQYFSLLAQAEKEPGDPLITEKLQRLRAIIAGQMRLAEESEALVDIV